MCGKNRYFCRVLPKVVTKIPKVVGNTAMFVKEMTYAITKLGAFAIKKDGATVGQ